MSANMKRLKSILRNNHITSGDPAVGDFQVLENLHLAVEMLETELAALEADSRRLDLLLRIMGHPSSLPESIRYEFKDGKLRFGWAMPFDLAEPEWFTEPTEPRIAIDSIDGAMKEAGDARQDTR